MVDGQQSKYKVSISDIKPITDKGGEVYVLLSPKTACVKNLIMGIGITPVNGKVTEHVHDYSEECFFVIQGIGRLHLDNGETVEFERGSAVRVPQGMRHWVENVGSEELHVVFASAPLASTSEVGHRNL